MPPASKPPASGNFDLRGAVKLDLVADPKAPDKPKKRRFTIEAYTGTPLKNQWDYPVVVDLEGIVLRDGIFPILDAHWASREAVVGQSDSAGIENGKLILRGVMFETEPSTQIAALADQGFKWQASIGAQTTKKEFVGEGIEAQCNGETYEGPIYISRVTELRETSFVVLGDDGNTSALVAALKGKRIKAMKMSFKEYCAANGHEDMAKMSAAETQEMKDKYCAADGGTSEEDDTEADDEEEEKDTEAEGKTDEDDEDTEAEGETDDDAKKKKSEEAKAAARLNIKAKGADMQDQLKAYRKENAKEERRLRRIREITAAAPDLKHEVIVNGKKKTVNIREHAIAAGWTPDRTAPAFELAQLRAERAGGDNGAAVPNTWYSKSTPQASEAVLEAAIMQSGQCRIFDSDFFGQTKEREAIAAKIKDPIVRELKARYTDQIQQSAHELYKGRMGLQELLIAGAAMSGKRLGFTSIRDDGQIEAVLRANNWIRAEGFSTANIANVLANVLNKFMLQGYLFGEMAWREITAIRPVKDFKPTKSINLFSNDGMQFLRVGADGALKHAALLDQAFANQVFTEGRLITINRQNIINDDLNMLSTVPMLVGRGAILRLNNLFWTQFLNPGLDDNGTSNFFSATHVNAAGTSVGNSNLSTGATTNMSSAGLQTAEILFDKQIGPDGQPLGIDPEILLFPPDVKVSAWELMNSEFLIYGGGTAAKQPQKNRFVGAYKPVMSRYLSNPSYTGYSTTAWYMLANPGMMPVIEMAFLNGQETPTVQTAQANFNILGIEIRGFFDIGVNSQNFRGGVKSAGA